MRTDRRIKNILFSAIIILGIALIIVAATLNQEELGEMYNTFFNTLLSIGTGLISSAVISIIILKSNIDEHEGVSVKWDDLQDNKLEQIYYFPKICNDNTFYLTPPIICEPIEQISAMNRLLKKLCTEPAVERLNGGKVYGVVVLFKGEKRRTVASFKGEKPEQNKTHPKKDGTVGLMLEYNDSTTMHSPEIEHYGPQSFNVIFTVKGKGQNTGIIYRYHHKERTESGNPQDVRLEIKQEKVHFCSSDTYALLAIPLFSSNLSARNTIIGALTLDFSTLKTQKQDKNQIKNMCRVAIEYAKIVNDIIGSYPKEDNDEYHNLVFGEWPEVSEWE